MDKFDVVAYGLDGQPLLGDDGEPQHFASDAEAFAALRRAGWVAELGDEAPEALARPVVPVGEGEMLVVWDVACDAQQGCAAQTTVQTWEPESDPRALSRRGQLREALEVEGWTLADDGLAYCPGH